MLNKEEYEVFLETLKKAEHRTSVSLMHTYLKSDEIKLIRNDGDIDKLIAQCNKRTQDKKDRISTFSTYKKYLTEKAYEKNRETIDGPEGKKNAIDYLLLFHDEYKVWLIRDKITGSLCPQGPYRDEVVFDAFYWRTTRDDVGVAKLRFLDGWTKAELVYHYLTVGKEQAFLTGDVHKNGENVYIDFVDAGADTDTDRIHSFWSLFIPKDTVRRDYVAGVFASSNRHNHEPICGKLMLKQNHDRVDIHQTDFVGPPPPGKLERVLQFVPDDIYYLIANARLKVPAQTILSEQAIPHHQEVTSLTDFCGTYQLYQPWHNAGLNLRKLVIENKGRAVLTGSKGDTIGYVDYCDRTLIIKFSYDAQADYYRFYFILEPTPDGQNLSGLYAGLTKEQELSSGRVFLSRKPADAIVISTRRAGAIRSYFETLLQTDIQAHAFLTDPELPTTDMLWMSHVNELNAHEQPPRTTPPPAYLTGYYNAFFLTKIELRPRGGDLDRRIKLAEQPIQLIQMPLYLSGSRAELIDGDRRVAGQVTYDGTEGLMINVREPNAWSSLILSIPKTGTDAARRHAYFYGVLSRLDKEPEASALIIYRENDPSRRVYRCFERFDELMAVESQYPGLVTFLFSDWGRFLRMPGHQKYEPGRLPPKYATFRRVFFAAACHYGSLGETTLCRDNLTRAFRHGFGLYRYANLNASQPGFPAELLEERQLLRTALTTALTDENITRYVNTYWKLNEYP